MYSLRVSTMSHDSSGIIIVSRAAGSASQNSKNLAQVKRWGANCYRQLGYGDSVQRGDNANEMGDFLGYFNLGAGGRTASSVAAGI
jgi:hypothetical protein